MSAGTSSPSPRRREARRKWLDHDVLEVAVAVAKPSPQVSERGRDVGVVHGQDAFGDRDGTRIAPDHLLAGDEQHGNDPAVVGEKPKRAPRHHWNWPLRRRSTPGSVQTAAVLQCRDQRQCGLRPLVEVGAVSTEPVVASTAVGVEHRGVGVVVAEEPGDRPLDAGRPAVIFDVASGPSAGVRQGGNLDRLLVEGGPWVPGPLPPAGVTDR